MTSQDLQELNAADLPIALYLNQRLTFDSLASLEDGFSQFSTVQTTTAGARSSGVEGEGQLGISNAFALVGIKLGAKGFRKADQNQSESVTDEIVHTPTSLFARLRKELRDRSMVSTIEALSDVGNVSPGDFVEFEATLTKSPIVELLQSYSELFPLIALFQEQPPTKGRNKRAPQAPSENDRVAAQIDAILSVLTANGSLDVIAELADLRVVLTTEQSYFVDTTMNDLIDGSFRVFGKVTRVLRSDSGETISLLRKSPLGKFGSIVHGITEMMVQTDEDGDLHFKGSTETEVGAPALQVIPIAIFS